MTLSAALLIMRKKATGQTVGKGAGASKRCQRLVHQARRGIYNLVETKLTQLNCRRRKDLFNPECVLHTDGWLPRVLITVTFWCVMSGCGRYLGQAKQSCANQMARGFCKVHVGENVHEKVHHVGMGVENRSRA